MKRLICLFVLFGAFGFHVENAHSQGTQDDPYNIDAKLFFNLQGYNVPFGGITAGLNKWLNKNYKVCKTHGTFVIRTDEGGDPNSPGCYIAYGPANMQINQWVILALVIEKNKRFNFGYLFDFTGKDFILRTFHYENIKMTDDKAKKIFFEIVGYKETKNFGR
jgi:hypothetical protein